MQKHAQPIPLLALRGVALDLETTGLDPRRDRIIQIGLVTFTAGGAVAQRFQKEINPGIPVPAASTRIHGLDDAALAGAPDFPTLFGEVMALVGDLPVIGFNLGFDLALLVNECARHDINWTPPRALCLRLMARALLGPARMAMLNDLSELARHFDVTAGARHTALGDAETALRLFTAMLPALRAAGVRTFTEAEAQMAGLSGLRTDLASAGWVDLPIGAAPVARTSSFDPYPFSRRVGELSRTPPCIMPPEATLDSAARAMLSQKTDCIFVGGGPQDIQGIVSERDIVSAIATIQGDAGSVRGTPLSKLMKFPVAGVRRRDFLYRALGRMDRLHIRHLAVWEEDGSLYGWVSARELAHSRARHSYRIGDSISVAENTADLAAATADLPKMAAALLDEGAPVRLIASVISQEYRAMTTRAAELALEMMQAEGMGAPPARWSLLVLGSAGRGESLLAADQDNAILFEDGADDAETTARRDWFLQLGGKVADILDAAGIPYCNGGVMASRPDWCRSLAGWQSEIRSWTRRSNPDDLLKVDIFFDLRHVAGDPALTARLMYAVQGEETRGNAFLKTLGERLSNHHPPVGLMGRLRTKDGRVDLKLGGLLPIVEFARILGISRSSNARSTEERLKLVAGLPEAPVTVAALVEDQELILRLTLRQQLADIAAGVSPGSKVVAQELSQKDRTLLKQAFGRTGEITQLLREVLYI